MLSTLRSRLQTFWLRLPVSVRKAATDFWTYLLAGLLALQLPADTTWKQAVAIVGFIALNAARRSWLGNKDAVIYDATLLVKLTPEQTQALTTILDRAVAEYAAKIGA
jgi:hypothetical protein